MGRGRSEGETTMHAKLRNHLRETHGSTLNALMDGSAGLDGRDDLDRNDHASPRSTSDIQTE
jgi:hypothetical protein